MSVLEAYAFLSLFRSPFQACFVVDYLWIVYNIVESYQQGDVDNNCIVDGIQIFKVRVSSNVSRAKVRVYSKVASPDEAQICCLLYYIL